MFEKWLSADPTTLLLVAISTIGIYLAVILFTRLAGLRSFSKMSSFDFAMTVAIGSLVATTLLTSDPPLLVGIVGLATIYGLQETVGLLRRFEWMQKLVDNTPVLVMRDGEILHENLRETQMTEEDLRSKLREHNIFRRSEVRAVVFETTGDVSVLRTRDENLEVEAWLLADVEDAEGVEQADQAAGQSRAPAQ
ncbi:MAG: DUF421 domain-containing protein [Persicimonas sp.]